MNKTERLQARITPELKEDLRKLAAAEGISMTDYVEKLIYHAVAEEIRMYAKAEAEVNEKCPDLDEAEKAFLIHEQMMTKKAIRSRMDRVQHMKRELQAKRRKEIVGSGNPYIGGDHSPEEVLDVLRKKQDERKNDPTKCVFYARVATKEQLEGED